MLFFTKPCFLCELTLVEQLHAVEGGQRGEQAGVKTHGQQVPQATLVEGLTAFTHTAQGLCHCYFIDHSNGSDRTKPFKTAVSLEFMRSCQTVPLVPEPSYPLCAYLALEQPADVFLPKD